MTLIVAASVGFVAARLLWVALKPTFAVPALVRPNYRGRTVITAVGVVVPLATVVVEGGRAAAASLGVGRAAGIGPARLAVLLAVVGFGLLGLLDDLLGRDERRGFRGHAAALLSGRLTTGGVKLVGGVAVALVVVSPASGGGTRHLLDAALVASTANLANLLDRRPGRVIKATAGAFVVLVAATSAVHVLVGVAVAVGAGLGLLLEDLHERVLMGDVGANALGAVVGLGVVLACAPTVRTAVLVVTAAMNVASEVVSFSTVIQSVAPLRALDRAGQRR